MSAASAALVVAWAAVFVGALRPASAGGRVRALSRPSEHRTGLFERAGRFLHRRAGHEADARRHRLTGRSVAVVGAATVVDPLLGVTAAIGAVVVVRWRRIRAEASRRSGIVRGLPDGVDLFRLAVDGGLTLPMAVPVVARWSPPELAPALQAATARLDRGHGMASALDGLGAELGTEGQSLVDALRDHHHYGTPLGPGLERAASEAGRARQRASERRIRRLPVTLLFPLVLCTLPAFGALTVGPLLVDSLASLTDVGRPAPAMPGGSIGADAPQTDPPGHSGATEGPLPCTEPSFSPTSPSCPSPPPAPADASGS